MLVSILHRGTDTINTLISEHVWSLIALLLFEVPQGSILGTSFFILYILPLGSILRGEKKEVSLQCYVRLIYYKRKDWVPWFHI